MVAFSDLEVEPRTFCLLGKTSTVETESLFTPEDFFALACRVARVMACCSVLCCSSYGVLVLVSVL